MRIELGAPGDFVRPGQVHCVGAGGKMAYDWMAGVAGPIEPESASEDEVEPYFPYRCQEMWCGGE